MSTFIVVALIACALVVFSVAWANAMTGAIDRRRAWNLWAAGIIDDDELRERLGE